MPVFKKIVAQFSRTTPDRVFVMVLVRKKGPLKKHFKIFRMVPANPSGSDWVAAPVQVPDLPDRMKKVVIRAVATTAAGRILGTISKPYRG